MSSAVATSTRAALVVAAYDFEDPKFQRLRSPARDVDALADVLADPGIGGFTVQSVVNQPNGVVQRELERFFSSRKPDDLLLVYFSCHGVKDSTGRLYFATTNTAFDLLRSTGVPASFVSEQMELTRSKRIVLLLDCCYSGAFIKGFQARGDDSVSVSQLEGRGRAVITASRSTEYAFEADELKAANAQPSVFTGAVVEGLATGQADRNGDGVVTVDELYDFVYDHVRGKVAGQTPGRWVNLEGELAVARNPHPPVHAAVLPAELLRAVESDVALHRLGAVWQLGEWLDQGEPGQQMTAREVLERLTQDYDQRVRTAASSFLTGPAVVDPTPASTSTPPPAPEPALAAAATTAAPPAPDPAVEPEPALAAAATTAAPPAPDPVIEPEPALAAAATTAAPPAPDPVAEPDPALSAAATTAAPPAADPVAEPEPALSAAATTAAPPAADPAAEPEPALSAAATTAAPPAADPVAEPERPAPPAPPASATAAGGGAPDRPLEVTGVAATRTPSEAEPTDGRLRRIGWLALTAVIASAVAAFLPFIQKDGYTVVRLIEENWYDLWLLGVGGLAVWAAVSLLGQGRDRGPGIALVLGIAPAAVASGFGLSAWIAGYSQYDSGVAGPGYVIAMIGRVALTAAAVLAATRAREYLPLAPPPAPRAAGLTALAALIGAGSALGLGALTVNDYLRSGLDLPGSLLGKFALGLLLLTAIACVLSGWLADHRIRGRLRVVGTVLLYAFVVVLFVNAADPSGAPDSLYLGWYVALVVGAMVVPVASTLVLPRRQGAILLAAWTAGMAAEAGYDLWHGADTAARVVLSLSLVAAIALAAALWTGRVDRLTGEPSPVGS